MRILHFSDFHLNGYKLDEARHNLSYMIKALSEISKERKIDLVLFTGDMVEQGGEIRQGSKCGIYLFCRSGNRAYPFGT